MPELFPDLYSFIACALIMAGAMFLYAAVGFGAGMFSVALLAMVLPGLTGTVTVLMLLTFVAEVWVLAHDWRRGHVGLLVGLVPAMAVGSWLGTQILAGGDVALLKRLLGLFVLAAGTWFLFEHVRKPRHAAKTSGDADSNKDRNHSGRTHPLWLSLAIGLVSGVLGGLFGTGGPPVIILLRSYKLDKSAFRATILWYFFLMSLFRSGAYLQAGLLTFDVVMAGLWLLPTSIGGILIGMAVHRRVSERQFAAAVSVLLIILGVLLAAGLKR